MATLFADTMRRLLPDPTFYASPRAAMDAPPETMAYVALINPHPETAGPTPSRSWTATAIPSD
jgi:hypothetical protein